MIFRDSLRAYQRIPRPVNGGDAETYWGLEETSQWAMNTPQTGGSTKSLLLGRMRDNVCPTSPNTSSPAFSPARRRCAARADGGIHLPVPLRPLGGRGLG